MTREVESAPAVVELILSEIEHGSHVLEVGAASVDLANQLLRTAGHVTVLEPSLDAIEGMLSEDAPGAEDLSIVQGSVQDLSHVTYYDTALVAHPALRGMGLLHTIAALATHVHDRVIVLMEDEGTLDWAYLARTAVNQGFAVRLHLVALPRGADGAPRRAVMFVTDLRDWQPSLITVATLETSDIREVDVPFPLERGAATGLVRGFVDGGDRVMALRTSVEGTDRLYGAIRTAVHRLARELVTVRRVGDVIQMVRVPKVGG